METQIQAPGVPCFECLGLHREGLCQCDSSIS